MHRLDLPTLATIQYVLTLQNNLILTNCHYFGGTVRPLFGAKFPTVPLFFFDSVPCTFYASKMSQFGPISYLANIPLFLTENSTSMEWEGILMLWMLKRTSVPKRGLS